MFVISLNFPYEYQIKKIYPDLEFQLLKKAETMAFEHAISKIIHRDSHFYFFDDEKEFSTFFFDPIFIFFF